MLKMTIVILMFICSGLVVSCGMIPTQVQSSITSINVSADRLAIKGYDPVAYHTQSSPVLGREDISAQHNGAVYHFSTAEHKAMFELNPDQYAPQYGGYCAFGVSKEYKFDADPTAWAIVDKKLYLNLNEKVQNRWVQDKDALINEADASWKEIAHIPASELSVF